MQLHSVVQRPSTGLPAYRIGQGGHTAKTGGHRGHPPLVEAEPVDESAGDPLIFRLSHIGPIRLEYCRRSILNSGGHAHQGLPA